MFERYRATRHKSAPTGVSADAPLLRWPSLRSPWEVAFLLACAGLILYVLAPEIWGGGKTKDYPLWFWVGQQVLHGKAIYETNASATFNFIYPPLPALLLALPTYLGKIPFYLALCLVSAAAWWVAGTLCNRMANPGGHPMPAWVAALPSLAMLPPVVENIDLGQPNLLLLALMLFGFWLLQKGRPWSASSLFALATAIKAFPVAVLPYLLWRRHWAAAAGTAVWLAVFLFLVPAPFRGFDRNLAEVGTWFHGMVGSYSEKGFGQREEQNWSWKNQSLIAVTHRLLRPLNYNQIDASEPPAYVNLLDLDFKTANWVLLALSALIGLGFAAVMPPRPQVTALSRAEELGILFCLMTIASPLARQYYFVWLYLPVTVLIQRAAFDPRPGVRLATWWLLAAAGGLVALSLPILPTVFQALGNYLAATLAIAGGLAWHMRNPPPIEATRDAATDALEAPANGMEPGPRRQSI